MKATLTSRKASGKGSEFVTLTNDLTSALYNAFVGKDEKGTPIAKSERIEDAASLASIWDKVTEKYPNLDSILIEDYKTVRSATKKNGEEVSQVKSTYPAKMLVKNLNVQAILAGIASDLEKEGKLSEGTKTMYRLAVTEEAIGFTKGKRGRSAKVIDTASKTSKLLANL